MCKQEIELLTKQVEDLAKELKSCHIEIQELRSKAIQKQKKVFLKFEVHLCDHCNLNCKGCDHFSPIAPPKFTDTKTFSKDMHRIAELFGDRVLRIHLLGGEPLLAPNVCDYISIAREAFPNKELTIIDILTNGTLLLKQPKAFWDACKEYSIKIRITKYPISLDYDEICKFVSNQGVECDFFNDLSNGEKGLYKVCLTKDPHTDPHKNFFNCFDGNRCIMLKNGKLYPCTLIPNVEHFNKYFGETFYETNFDSIDIHQAKSAEEIFEFLHNPVPFCRYCKRDDIESLSWEKSQKAKDEWM